MKLLLALFSAVIALVAAPVNQVTLVSAGSPLVSDGAYYVGPYTLHINAQNLPVLCVDFKDETLLNDTWSAYFSNLSGSLVDTYQSDLVQYEKEAYLFTLIVSPGADRIDIQHAAWAITDPNFNPDQAALYWIDKASQNYLAIDPSKFEIISDTDRGAPTRPQEFITTASPEPPLLELIGGILAFACALLGRKRQKSGA